MPPTSTRPALISQSRMMGFMRAMLVRSPQVARPDTDAGHSQKRGYPFYPFAPEIPPQTASF
jgi:hypothetical protein